ncbi:Glucose-6-phosphate isomerase [Durusdinium trenchii]|uniref:Glucose-6-phosphate isomerase n=1 Tax=Durusdinium trenchii TaxID=1381693 RepID=A0ABP0IEI2_9DINO
MAGKPGRGPAWETAAWAALSDEAAKIQSDKGPHLRDLLKDEARCGALQAEFDGILMDYARQKVTLDTRQKLLDLADAVNLKVQITAMASGKFINTTENRAVMHIALRAPKGEKILVGDVDVVPEVHEVLDRIYDFADRVRSGKHAGATGKKLTNVISIGIGGSYLGPEFVHEALRTDEAGAAAAEGRSLRFLANVDPVDVKRALEGLDPESTLVVVVSKTFTTAETMLNARTVSRWLEEAAKSAGVDKSEMIAKHMIAVSANVPGAQDFGIDGDNVFGFWDWVGGRYSVCSAVGVMPLALQYGKAVVQEFLAGAQSMDEHFLTAPLENNLPVLLGLLGVWNSSFLGYSVRCLLPYSQALLRFPAHIQQVDMESNGKRVALDGTELPFDAGEINFGEPMTNGQHSFMQLIHQGRVVPCDFLGSIKSQNPIDNTGNGEPVSNHDELMSNFFAQADALAMGKTQADLKAEGVPEKLWPHKEFPGNRPTTSILFPCFDARRVGQLLSLYEHRSAVQGFVWGINSFDQWGVELGKVLAKQVRTQLQSSRQDGAKVKGFNPSTTSMLERFVASQN